MKILLSHKLEGIGGGSRFLGNFLSGFKKYFPDVEFTYDRDCVDYDILFILTPTSIDSFDFIDKAKEMGKKIILRLDNQPKPSRNRRYGIREKMANLAGKADQLIFQSQWAKHYVGWNLSKFIADAEGVFEETEKGAISVDKKRWEQIKGVINGKSTVVLNGVNEEIFKKEGPATDYTNGNPYKDIFLVLTSSSDPCKRLHESLAIFEQEHRKAIDDNTKPVKLVIGGRLPDEYHVKKMEAGWDFVNDEQCQYIGELHSPEAVATTMRGCTQLLFPSFNDASPNTILEAKACGLNIIASMSGGTQELLTLPEHKFGLNIMCSNYLKVFERVLNNKW